jgi:hypothetical protein
MWRSRVRAAAENGLSHSLRRLLGRFVLPHADDLPARSRKSRVVGAVTSDISIEFRVPIGRVAPRPSAVFRTAVPVAAVYERNQLLSRKYNVRTASAFERACVFAEAQAKAMER